MITECWKKVPDAPWFIWLALAAIVAGMLWAFWVQWRWDRGMRRREAVDAALLRAEGRICETCCLWDGARGCSRLGLATEPLFHCTYWEHATAGHYVR